jgi:hypothetical protein
MEFTVFVPGLFSFARGLDVHEVKPPVSPVAPAIADRVIKSLLFKVILKRLRLDYLQCFEDRILPGE